MANDLPDRFIYIYIILCTEIITLVCDFVCVGAGVGVVGVDFWSKRCLVDKSSD